MSKPLTIDELKALKVGDWVWLVECDLGISFYAKIEENSVDYIDVNCPYTGLEEYEYRHYGKTWIAYKNKEQAEAKGEIVELPCIAMIEQGLVDGKMKQTQEAQGFNGRYAVVYMDKTKYKKPLIDVCWSQESKFKYSEAERRLAELKGEKR